MKSIYLYLLTFLIPVSGITANTEVGKTEKQAIKENRSKDYILESEEDWEPAGEGVVRKIMGYDKQVMLVKVKFQKGATGAPHTHPHTQTTYVASGKFEFNINGKKQTVSTGDGIYIEPDALHSCICLEEGLLIDCFAPMREDFLKQKQNLKPEI